MGEIPNWKAAWRYTGDEQQRARDFADRAERAFITARIKERMAQAWGEGWEARANAVHSEPNTHDTMHAPDIVWVDEPQNPYRDGGTP